MFHDIIKIISLKDAVIYISRSQCGVSDFGRLHLPAVTKQETR